MFRNPEVPNDSLKAKIPEGKLGIADGGLKGEPDKLAISRNDHSAEVKKFFGRVKARQETFNGRIKSFNILENRFRHGFTQHKQCFESVCILVQYDIKVQ